jgi:heme-degrading monooxygenase HmoA
MSSVIAYSQVVTAEVSRESWDELYFSLLSLKAHLQSLPGWQRFDFWARDQEDGDIKLVVVTNWEFPEQLALWLEQGVTTDSILRSIEPPPKLLEVDLYEEIA